MNYSFMYEAEEAYRLGKPIMTDEEWDKLVQETGYQEHLVGELLTASGRNMIPMNTPLISVQKIYKVEDLEKFLDGKEFKGKKLVVEPKLDGACFDAIYKVEDDGTASLVHIGSAGDGENMFECYKDAFADVRTMGLPQGLSVEETEKLKDFIIDGHIEIRGEAIISPNSWKAMNKDILEEGQVLSYRNILSGIMNRKNPMSFAYVLSQVEKEDLSEPITTKNKDSYLKKTGYFKAFDDVFGKGKWYVIKGRLEEIEVVSEDMTEMTLEEFTIEHFDLIKGVNCLYECVDFVTYGISSKEGNCDPDVLYDIPSLITFNEMNTIEAEEADLGPFTKYVVDNDKSGISFIKKYLGYMFGLKELYGEDIQEMRKLGPFICDGIVIKTLGEPDAGVYRTSSIQKGRILGHHPVNRLACKLEGKKYRVHLSKIWEEVTEKGNHTMHGLLEPELITDDGAHVKNINLHNPEWLKQNSWIQGDHDYDLVMSADLIPILKEI